jgi:pimeloyl-ACP methyl ester carboxylesterase
MTTSGTQFLDRGKGRIAYDVTGSGPLVIAVPGMADLRSTYRHLVPELVAAGFRVATLDLRGQGDSDLTFNSFDDPAAASDILALAAHLGDTALVIGNSMGAAAAVIAAAERPDQISGLVLIGAYVRDPQVAAWQRLMMRALMGGPWARLAWMAYFPKFFPSRRGDDYVAHHNAISDALARPGYGRAFRQVLRTSHAPAEAVLDDVHTQVLVVMGSKDPDFADQQGEAEWIAERLGGSAVMIPDAGHYPHSEFPELTGPRILEFAQHVTSGEPDA